MRVADSRDPVGSVVRRPAERRRQRLASGARGRRHVGQVERVEGGLEGEQDLDLARIVRAELGSELVEHLDVREQLTDLRADLDDGGGHQAVHGIGRRGDLVPSRVGLHPVSTCGLAAAST